METKLHMNQQSGWSIPFLSRLAANSRCCACSRFLTYDMGLQFLRGYLNIELEEVLPRPQAGLLNRLLRLARVEWLDIPEKGPVFIVQPGKEYMVSQLHTIYG
jgi:hypothetical protein